jgi:hypothetical protein
LTEDNRKSKFALRKFAFPVEVSQSEHSPTQPSPESQARSRTHTKKLTTWLILHGGSDQVSKVKRIKALSILKQGQTHSPRAESMTGAIWARRQSNTPTIFNQPEKVLATISS